MYAKNVVVIHNYIHIIIEEQQTANNNLQTLCEKCHLQFHGKNM